MLQFIGTTMPLIIIVPYICDLIKIIAMARRIRNTLRELETVNLDSCAERISVINLQKDYV